MPHTFTHSSKKIALFSFKKVKKRILIITLGFFLFFIIIIGRAFVLLLSDNEKLNRLANLQYKKRIAATPRRGSIYDKNGDEMALDVQATSLYANPQLVSNRVDLINQLSSILEIENTKIDKSLNPEKKFVWIARKIDDQKAEKIRQLKNPALGLVKEYRRDYPNQSLASTLLGAVGTEFKGLGGLELYYENNLKSKTEPYTVDTDARGQAYNPEGLIKEIEEPNSITLTIDKSIQFIVEKELKTQVEKTQALSGVALVMDVHTGEVLAMASFPDFNPNSYNQYPPENWRIRAITDSFEPGSIFKAITAAAALESGKVDANKKFNCEGGAYQVGKFTINDHGNYGEMNLADIIRVSNNICSYKIAQYVGKDFFSKIVTDFGFGKKTGLDLPGEIDGLMQNPEKWSALKMGTIAFGQGISVTPIQVVTAYSAIANGGWLLKPHLIKKISDSNSKTIKEWEPQKLRRVMSEANSKKLIELLKGVVGPGGTGTLAQVDEYPVAGKTGTAQKVAVGKKGYLKEKYIASFAGIAPADQPRIAVLVSVNEPRGNHFGGIVAAPVFREIVRKTLPKLGVKPLISSSQLIKKKELDHKNAHPKEEEPVLEESSPIEESE